MYIYTYIYIYIHIYVYIYIYIFKFASGALASLASFVPNRLFPLSWLPPPLLSTLLAPPSDCIMSSLRYFAPFGLPLGSVFLSNMLPKIHKIHLT